jgi:hypothetical protein
VFGVDQPAINQRVFQAAWALRPHLVAILLLLLLLLLLLGLRSIKLCCCWGFAASSSAAIELSPVDSGRTRLR